MFHRWCASTGGSLFLARGVHWTKQFSWYIMISLGRPWRLSTTWSDGTLILFLSFYEINLFNILFAEYTLTGSADPETNPSVMTGKIRWGDISRSGRVRVVVAKSINYSTHFTPSSCCLFRPYNSTRLSRITHASFVSRSLRVDLLDRNQIESGQSRGGSRIDLGIVSLSTPVS